ncbi:MAG: ZIP family metal transporter [Candidatus Micrarchaeota archaeon]
MVLEQILLATAIVSAISLLGVFTLSIKDELLHALLPPMVAFAGGALLATAFFDILPESLAASGIEGTMRFAVVGVLLSLIIEKFLHWHHHHKHHHRGDKTEQPFTYLALIGGSIHNFIDGTIIAASFIVSPAMGIVSTFAIIAHEIPHEVGDFSLLIYGGFSRRKALLFNFLSGLVAIAGSLAAFFLSPVLPGLAGVLLPIAAGNFIYISCVDLVPDMHKEQDLKKSALQFLLFLLGMAVIIGYGMLEPMLGVRA